MSISTLNTIRRNFPWSLSGFLLAAILGAITIYTEFFRDQRPEIQFDVLSDSSVLDVREEVTDLKIIHAGADLRQSGQSLRVIVVRVSNIGGEDVLKSFYDEAAPLGFSIENGELISIELQDTSETYLDDRVNFHIKDLSRVVFSPVIFGPKSYFSVRVLIKHTESTLPVLTPIGRVARVRSISLIQAPSPQLEGLNEPAFAGLVWR